MVKIPFIRLTNNPNHIARRFKKTDIPPWPIHPDGSCGECNLSLELCICDPRPPTTVTLRQLEGEDVVRISDLVKRYNDIPRFAEALHRHFENFDIEIASIVVYGTSIDQVVDVLKTAKLLTDEVPFK